MRVRNWAAFQHYKHRNPPWIKLHFDLLSSGDWVTLSDSSRVLAVACMLIASRNDGELPDNPEYIQRVAYLNGPPDFKPLIECGFLEVTQADAIALQADASNCERLRTNADTELETETETELERRFRFDAFYDGYAKKVNRKSAIRAWEKLSEEDRAEAIRIAPTWRAAYIAAGKKDFIPHPSTWLNNRRWEDEELPPPIQGDDCQEELRVKMQNPQACKEAMNAAANSEGLQSESNEYAERFAKEFGSDEAGEEPGLGTPDPE